MKNILGIALISLSFIGVGCATNSSVDKDSNTSEAAVSTVNEDEVTDSALGAEEDAEWVTYRSTNNEYSFYVPPYVHVATSDDDSRVTLASTSFDEGPVPDMTVDVSDTSVRIATWEEFDVEYYRDLVNNFVFSGISNDGWITYEHPTESFSFRHPSYVHVSASDDGSSLTLASTPFSEQPVPDMTISLTDTSVHFRVWENFDVEYFKGLISSFRL